MQLLCYAGQAYTAELVGGFVMTLERQLKIFQENNVTIIFDEFSKLNWHSPLVVKIKYSSSNGLVTSCQKINQVGSKRGGKYLFQCYCNKSAPDLLIIDKDCNELLDPLENKLVSISKDESVNLLIDSLMKNLGDNFIFSVRHSSLSEAGNKQKFASVAEDKKYLSR